MTRRDIGVAQENVCEESSGDNEQLPQLHRCTCISEKGVQEKDFFRRFRRHATTVSPFPKSTVVLLISGEI